MNTKNIYIDNTTKSDVGNSVKATGVFLFSKYEYSKKIKNQKFLNISNPLYLYNQRTKAKVSLETYEASVIVIKRDKNLDIAVEVSDMLAKELFKQPLVLVN